MLQLQRADRLSDGLSFIALQPARVIDPFKDWDERANVLPLPRDFGAFLSDHPNLDVLGERSTTVGGIRVTAIDSLVTSVPTENPWPTCGGCVTLLALTAHHQTGPITTDDLINALGPGEIDRYIVLKAGEHTLLVNAFAATRADFREFAPIVQRVLDTVAIGDAPAE